MYNGGYQTYFSKLIIPDSNNNYYGYCVKHEVQVNILAWSTSILHYVIAIIHVWDYLTAENENFKFDVLKIFLHIPSGGIIFPLLHFMISLLLSIPSKLLKFAQWSQRDLFATRKIPIEIWNGAKFSRRSVQYKSHLKKRHPEPICIHMYCIHLYCIYLLFETSHDFTHPDS